MWGLSAGQQEQLLLRLNPSKAGKEVTVKTIAFAMCIGDKLYAAR